MAGSNSFLALSDPTQFMTRYQAVADQEWKRYEAVQLTIKDFEDANPKVLGPDADIDGKDFQWLQRRYTEREKLEGKIKSSWTEYATAFAKTVEGWVKTGYLVPSQEIMSLLTQQVMYSMQFLHTDADRKAFLASFDAVRGVFFKNNPGVADRLSEDGQKLFLADSKMTSDHPMAIDRG
jgi:hypothetical protein